MIKASDRIRGEADLIKRGDLYAPTQRGGYPRYLPEVYEEVANLRDRVDAYGQIIQRLNDKVERLERGKKASD